MGEYAAIKTALICEIAKMITTNMTVKRARLLDGAPDATEWDRIRIVVGCGDNPQYEDVVRRVAVIMDG
jgi:hypothetical protein